MDVGGTFTDLLLISEDGGETWRAKTPSTPADPSIGVLAGIEKVCRNAGVDPQSEGSINFDLNENMLKMFFGIYMIMVFDPQILWNDGFYPLVEVRIPEGGLLRPRHPAALSCRAHALGRIFDVLGGLLGQRAPESLNAAGFSSSPHLMYSGTDRDGEWFQLYQIGFGGIPGRPFGDGPDGHSLWPSFTNVPTSSWRATSRW